MRPAVPFSFRGRTPQVTDCVFDLGGVVVDWNPRYLYRKLFEDAAAMEHFLAEIGFAEWNMEQDRGRPFADGVRLLTEQFPHHASMIAAYDQRWEESIPGPIQGTLEILQKLRTAGYPLHALTNWSAEKFAIAERRFPFDAWFDQIVVSGREGICKPEPAIFQQLLERIGRTAGDCLFVDDSEANVLAAEELGFSGIVFVSPQQLNEELLRLGILSKPAQERNRSRGCV